MWSRARRPQAPATGHAQFNRARGYAQRGKHIMSVGLAGVVGFEPTVHGTKNRCLTAWLHPNRAGADTTPSRGDQAPPMRFLHADFLYSCGASRRSVEDELLGRMARLSAVCKGRAPNGQRWRRPRQQRAHPMARAAHYRRRPAAGGGAARLDAGREAGCRMKDRLSGGRQETTLGMSEDEDSRRNQAVG